MSDETTVEETTQEQSEVSQSVPAEQPSANYKGTQGDTSSAPKWKFADGVAGSGEVPDWFLATKYRTVEDQAKAAYELRKKLGAKSEDAPEEYSIDYEKYAIDKDDPVLKEFSPFFKEMNLSQDAYEKIIDKFVGIQKNQQEEFQKGLETAWDAFGPETKSTMQRLNTWVGNNFTPEEAKIIQGFQTSAEEIRVLEKMRQGSPKSAPPTANQVVSQNSYETLDMVNAEISKNWDRIKEDANYRKVMFQKREEARNRG